MRPPPALTVMQLMEHDVSVGGSVGLFEKLSGHCAAAPARRKRRKRREWWLGILRSSTRGLLVTAGWIVPFLAFYLNFALLGDCGHSPFAFFFLHKANQTPSGAQ